MSRTIHCASLAAWLLLTSCISVEVSGPTGQDLQAAITKSNTARNIGWYYPDGVPADAARYIAPNSAGQSAIKANVTEQMAAIARLHELRRPAVESMIGKALLPNAPGKIVVLADARPIAKAEPNGQIHISYLVLQALLRGALLEEVVDPSDSFDSAFFDEDGSQYIFNATLDPKDAKSEQQQGLSKVVDVIARARKLKAPGKIGTVLAALGDDDLDGPWFQLAELHDEFVRVDVGYTGAILFLLAHEQGHLVLQHHETLQAQTSMVDRCALQVELEKEADDYALTLLSLLSADTPIPDWFYQGRAGAFTGYRAYLQYSYALSGFAENAGCAYPSNEARFERLAAKHKALQIEAKQRLEAAFQAALQKALDERK